jgi:hypothetical protein
VLARELVIDKALTLRGAGRDKTHIVSAAPEFVVKFTGPGPRVLEELDISFIGTAKTDLVIASCEACDVISCRLANATARGLVVQGRFAQVRNCTLEANAGGGISIEGQQNGK